MQKDFVHFGALVCSMTIIAIWSVFMGEVTFCEFLFAFPSFHFCGFYLVSLRNLSSCEGSNCEV